MPNQVKHARKLEDTHMDAHAHRHTLHTHRSNQRRMCMLCIFSGEEIHVCVPVSACVLCESLGVAISRFAAGLLCCIPCTWFCCPTPCGSEILFFCEGFFFSECDVRICECRNYTHLCVSVCVCVCRHHSFMQTQNQREEKGQKWQGGWEGGRRDE